MTTGIINADGIIYKAEENISLEKSALIEIPSIAIARIIAIGNIHLFILSCIRTYVPLHYEIEGTSYRTYISDPM